MTVFTTTTKARKSAYEAHLDQRLLGERGYQLANVTTESFARLGKTGTDLATSVTGEKDNGNLRRNREIKEHPTQKIPVTPKVVISRGLEWFRSARGGRRETRQNTSTSSPDDGANAGIDPVRSLD